MGGIRSTGMSIDCDRCGKTEPVDDAGHEEFYKSFAEREDRDEPMFVCSLIHADGTRTDIVFEYLCPKCVKSIFSSYLTKVDKKLSPAPKAKAEKTETKAKAETKTKVVEPEPEPAPEPEPEPESLAEYSDDELFAVT